MTAWLFVGQNPVMAAPRPDTSTPAPFSLRAGNIPFPTDLKNKIKHIIIIYPENRSFDSLYASVSGVNGVNTNNFTPQTDVNGTTLTSVPSPNITGQRIDNQTITLVNGAGTVSASKANGGFTQDTRFANATIANAPYDVSSIIPVTSYSGDMIHNFYVEQYQINDHNNTACTVSNDVQSPNGAPTSKMTVFTTNPGLTLSHVDASGLGEGQLASSYTICDNAFHAAYGGSFLNHQYLISARAPVYLAYPGTGSAKDVFTDGIHPTFTPNQNNGYTAQKPTDNALNNSTALQGSFGVTLGGNDYFAVNTIFPAHGPAGGGYSSSYTGVNAPVNGDNQTSNPNGLLPLQNHSTIGDLLTAQGLSWAWYSEGWGNAVLGKSDFLFQYHHQPFVYFSNYALSTTPVVNVTTGAVTRPGVQSGLSQTHLLDFDNGQYDTATGQYDQTTTGFLAKCQANTLEAVTFVKPIGEHNSHPGYASVKAGQDFVGNLVAQIQASPVWSSCAIFIVYDEHGGLYDHVTPPTIDAWGPGFRIPMIVVSPYSKINYVDHTIYNTTSLLAFIEGWAGLASLQNRDANANMPLNSFTYVPDVGSTLGVVASRATTYTAAAPLFSTNKAYFGAGGGTFPVGTTITAVGNVRSGFSLDSNGNIIGKIGSSVSPSATIKFLVTVNLPAVTTSPTSPAATYTYPVSITQ